MERTFLTDTVLSHGKMLHLDIYTAVKQDPVVLFISGMGGYAGICSGFMKELSGNGFTVIGMDLPGHGRSEGPRGRFTFREVMDAVTDLVTYAASHYNDSIGLMGTSLGGTFALYSAMHDGRLKAVLCHNAMDIASDLHVATRFPGLIGFALRHKEIFTGLFSWLPIPLKVLIDWRKVVNNRGLLQELYKDPFMVWSYSLGTWASFLDYGAATDISRISTPLKIVVGENDRLFTPEYCRSLSRRIGRDGAHFEVIPGGHGLTLEDITTFTPVAAAWFKETLQDGKGASHGAH